MTTEQLTTSSSVPFVRLDNADPELMQRLLGVVHEVASAGAFTMGRHLDLFEVEFAAYCDVDHAIGVSSGTEALALTLRALDVGVGDDVIVPANSFVATAEAVSAVGATPRFADVDPVTYLMTVATVDAALTPATRCVIPVHLYGATVDMDPIVTLARARGLTVVEDACQAHGAWYRGRRVGSLGHAGCFSFYPTKNLGGWGDGGAIVTNDGELAERIRLLRSHGERPRYRHRVIGTTARLDALQAAILRVKLAHLDGWNDARRRTAAIMRDWLADAPVTLPAAADQAGDHVHHLFVIQCDDRDGLRAALDRRGVGSAVHYPVPIHLTEAYAHLRHGPGDLPVTEALAGRICSLPLFPGLTEREAWSVSDAVKEAVLS